MRQSSGMQRRQMKIRQCWALAILFLGQANKLSAFTSFHCSLYVGRNAILRQPKQRASRYCFGTDVGTKRVLTAERTGELSIGWQAPVRRSCREVRETSMFLWQPIRYAAVFTGGIALSTWVNARVNRRNERIRQYNVDYGLARGGGPSPELFMQRLRFVHESAAIKSAIELGVFTKLGALTRRRRGVDGSQGDTRSAGASAGATVAEVAKICGCAERGMQVLLDALSSLRFIRKRPSRKGGSPRYSLTTSSAKYLDETSETCISGLADWYFSDLHMDPLLKHLTESVRRGRSAAPQSQKLSLDDPRWLALAQTIGPAEKNSAAAVARAALQGLKDVEQLSVLDVAVGHGMYGIECARRHKGLAVTALGSLPVLQQVAVPNARKAGIIAPGSTPRRVSVGETEERKSSDWSRSQSERYSSPSRLLSASDGTRGLGSDRYRLIAGDALEMESWGDSEYDLVIIPHYLHLLDRAGVRSILEKARRALKPDGRCIIVEVVPSEDRMDPATVFSLVVLAHTPGGNAYSLSELQKACVDAGFTTAKKIPLPNPRQGQINAGWRSTLLAAFPRQPKGELVLVADSATSETSKAMANDKPRAPPEQATKLPEEPEPWAYPMSLGDFFSIIEEIVRSSLPGAGPEL